MFFNIQRNTQEKFFLIWSGNYRYELEKGARHTLQNFIKILVKRDYDDRLDISMCIVGD